MRRRTTLLSISLAIALGVDSAAALGAHAGDLPNVADQAIASSPVDKIQAAETLITKLQDDYPDSFSAATWTGPDSLSIALVGKAPSGAIAAAKAAGFDVTFTVAPVSLAELTKRQDEVVSALARTGAADYTVAIDPISGRVLVTLGSNRTDDLPDPSELLAGVSAAGVTSIDVTQVVGAVAHPWSGYGGAELYQGTAYECTTGFSVVQGSTTGVATAGHCGSSLTTYFDPFQGATHSLTYKNGHVGTWGDFEWFTTSGTEVNQYYYSNSGAKRSVTSVMSPFVLRQSLWWYGRGTFNEYTSTVKYINVTVASRGHMVCMTQSLGGPGDSGGPVYNSSVAAGFTFGEALIDGGWRMCFSQAQYIDDAIGVSIKLA
jgi:streptogrisin C